ncbi:hypothetical protein OAT60_01895 [Luminiphilus sp.]|nr:hypothetical protein [Luminiphilus sp.]
METLNLSENGKKLIELYDSMVVTGYDREDGTRVNDAYNDFELRKFRNLVRPYFAKYEVKSLLDYGCGGSYWDTVDFDEETSATAKEFFGIDSVSYYEPARDIDQRQKVECVSCFDVLEHVFISDVVTVLRDIFSYAEKLVVINIACYDSAAVLPNGENAHITVRDPMWWKGILDAVSIDFPSVNVLFLASPTYRAAQVFELWNAKKWSQSKTYKVDLMAPELVGEAPPITREVSLTKDQLLAFNDAALSQDPEYTIKLIDLLQKRIHDKI